MEELSLYVRSNKFTKISISLSSQCSIFWTSKLSKNIFEYGANILLVEDKAYTMSYVGMCLECQKIKI
jgi:hypothetical protein